MFSALERERQNGSESESMAVDKPENGAESGKIDESLYSRQLYVLGEEAMKKMSKSRSRSQSPSFDSLQGQV